MQQERRLHRRRELHHVVDGGHLVPLLFGEARAGRWRRPPPERCRRCRSAAASRARRRASRTAPAGDAEGTTRPARAPAGGSCERRSCPRRNPGPHSPATAWKSRDHAGRADLATRRGPPTSATAWTRYTLSSSAERRHSSVIEGLRVGSSNSANNATFRPRVLPRRPDERPLPSGGHRQVRPARRPISPQQGLCVGVGLGRGGLTHEPKRTPSPLGRPGQRSAHNDGRHELERGGRHSERCSISSQMLDSISPRVQPGSDACTICTIRLRSDVVA